MTPMWYLVFALSSVFDWTISLGAYCLVNHTFGWIAFVLSFLSDIVREVKMRKMDKQNGK